MYINVAISSRPFDELYYTPKFEKKVGGILLLARVFVRSIEFLLELWPFAIFGHLLLSCA